MIAYASRTGTRRTLGALRAAGWRLLVSATGEHRTEGFRYALDNGAWTAFQKKKPFDDVLFGRLVERHGADADWLVVPDIVGGGRASLDFSIGWLDRLRGACPLLLIAVQDGMELADVRPLIRPGVGLFVGGTTDWKIATMPTWGGLKLETGCYLHVGRVNTVRRMRRCWTSAADSFDGTSVTRFVDTLPLLDGARRKLVEEGRYGWSARACVGGDRFDGAAAHGAA